MTVSLAGSRFSRGFLLSPVSLHWFLLAAVLTLPFLLTFPFLHEPFDHDEGTYATIAQGLLHGELPYRDYFDHKPPLIYLWYALSFLSFGESVESPRVMVAFAWSATTFLVYREGLLVGSRRVALLAAFLFAASSGFVKLQASANTEAFMLLPLTASLLAATKAFQTSSGRWYLAAGAFGGLAILTKQVAIVHLVLLIAFLAWSALRRADGPTAGRVIAYVGMGATATVGAITLPYVVAGGLSELFYANITYNRIYSGQIPYLDRIEPEISGFIFFVVVAAPVVAAATVAVYSFLGRSISREMPLLTVSLTACLIGAVFTGRAVPHYYVAVLPALCSLGAIGITKASGWSPRMRLTAIGTATVVTMLCLAVNGSAYLESTPESRHIARFGPNYATTEITRSAEVGHYIASLTAPNERFYNYGRESQLFFYADRLPATRFFYDRPFLLDPPTLDDGMNDLREAKPRLIVDTVSLVGYTDWHERHPELLREILANDYEYIGRFHFADFYLRK